MGRRLGAVVLAVVLVLLAVIVRRGLDGDSLTGESVAVICDTLVADACRQAFDGRDVRVEDPGVTLARISGSTAPTPFVWVTAETWAEMGRSELARLARPGDRLGASEPVNSSTRVAVVLAAGSADACPEATWACVAALRGLDIAAPSTDTTVGLLARAEAAAALNGSGQFSLADLRRLDPGWSELDNAAGVLATRPGQLDIAFADAASAAAITRAVEVAVPADSRSVIALVAVGVAGARNNIDPGDLEDALAARGWSPGSGAEALTDPISVNGLLAVWAG